MRHPRHGRARRQRAGALVVAGLLVGAVVGAAQPAGAQAAADGPAAQPVAEAPPVVQAPAAPGGVVNRSGEPWNSGVYFPGPSESKVAQHEAFAAWRGNPLDVSLDWPARDEWSDIISPHWLYETWAGTPQTKVFSVGMIPVQDDTASLAGCAAGEHDEKWVEFGSTIAEHGLADQTIIRLGWEFNGDWYAWSARDPEQFAECWRRIHTAAESTAPDLRWSWDVFRGPSKSLEDPRAAWPGDAYVDIVGVDDYDGWPAVVDEESWQVHYAGEGGLRSWADFAREHGKAFAVPEWGVYPGTDWAGSGGSDNPYYMERMAGFFAEVAPDLAYEAYFNQSASYYAGAIYGPTLNPLAAERYQQIW